MLFDVKIISFHLRYRKIILLIPLHTRGLYSSLTIMSGARDSTLIVRSYWSWRMKKKEPKKGAKNYAKQLKPTQKVFPRVFFCLDTWFLGNIPLHLPPPKVIKRFCFAPFLNKCLAKSVIVGIAWVRGLVMRLTNISIFAISFFQKDKGDDIFGGNISILNLVPDI